MEKKLRGICKKTPVFKGTCQKYVDKNIDKLADAFVKTQDTEKACISLKFCK